MTHRDNITAILECYFTGFKEEIIESACNRILEQEPCEDTISRQAVLDLAKKGVLISNGNYESVCKAINEIPSVTQKSDNKYRKKAKRWKNKWLKAQKSGRWIVHEKPHGIRYLECPYCNIWYLNEHLIRNSYCPNCGAKMIEPQESEDKG